MVYYLPCIYIYMFEGYGMSVFTWLLFSCISYCVCLMLFNNYAVTLSSPWRFTRWKLWLPWWWLLSSRCQSCCPFQGATSQLPPRYSPQNCGKFQKYAESKIGFLGMGGLQAKGVFLENLKNHRKPCRNYRFGIPRSWTPHPLINTIYLDHTWTILIKLLSMPQTWCFWHWISKMYSQAGGQLVTLWLKHLVEAPALCCNHSSFLAPNSRGTKKLNKNHVAKSPSKAGEFPRGSCEMPRFPPEAPNAHMPRK